MKIFHSCVFITATAWGAHASAQMSPNDVASFEQTSGTYSVDCGKADAAQVTVAVDSVTIEVGTKRLSGKPTMATGTSFGRGPPPPEYADFQVELMTTIASLYVMEGKDGRYLVFPELEYATGLEKHFGKGRALGPFQALLLRHPERPLSTDEVRECWWEGQHSSIDGPVCSRVLKVPSRGSTSG